MLSLLLSLSLSAPVPKHKPLSRPPLDHTISYKMHWGTMQWPARLCKDGHYECGHAWAGTWKIQGDTLTIREYCLNQEHPQTFTYTIRLKPGKWEGEMHTGDGPPPPHTTPFKLVR